MQTTPAALMSSSTTTEPIIRPELIGKYIVRYAANVIPKEQYEEKYFNSKFMAMLFARWWVLTHTWGEALVIKPMFPDHWVQEYP